MYRLLSNSYQEKSPDLSRVISRKYFNTRKGGGEGGKKKGVGSVRKEGKGRRLGRRFGVLVGAGGGGGGGVPEKR